MREVEFHQPVQLGDVVNFFTETVRVGRTSLTVRVSVEASAGHGSCEHVQVTEAEWCWSPSTRRAGPRHQPV